MKVPTKFFSPFNESSYLAANPDVADAVKAGVFRSGKEHYDAHGINEGRSFRTLPNSRKEKAFFLLDKKGKGLEIGPSHNPIAPKIDGFNVDILDHMNTKDLRNKYASHQVDVNNIEEVDFVWSGEPMTKLIGSVGCYDWIISSHVIEHIPDLINHLQECEALLKSEGVLSLVIPDKRFCFDYFNAVTSTGELLDAYSFKRVRPTPGQVFNHFSNASSRNQSIAWSDDNQGGADALVHSFSDAKTHWERAVSTLDYIDVHCWRFTPESFKLVVSDLARLGLINLEIKVIFDVTGCEFYVSLTKIQSDTSENVIDRKSILNTLRNV